MNTTPITSKFAPATYTVVGGLSAEARRSSAGVSIILLNRGGSVSRADALEEFERLHADEIISVEGPGGSWAVESLVSRFPRVRFLLLKEAANPGESINIAMEVAASPLAAVFWSGMKVSPLGFPETALSALKERPLLCAAPWFFDKKNEVLPCLPFPALHKKTLKVLSLVPEGDEAPALFPYDYCGIYHREKFLYIGGYDCRIRNSYWQKLDFGFRSRLWGESIFLQRLFMVTAIDNPPVENTAADRDYRAFFLKNLAVRVSGGRASLPGGEFFPFWFHSRCGIFTAIGEFRRARRWVEENTERFTQGSREAVEVWEKTGE
ncbi:MAG: hypothetical protein LBC67_06370 [Spirochaetales bacterium]|nr:hypothetical protein [Spirochaetales bacterium]